MLKSMTEKAGILVILLSFAVGAYAYPLLPESVASHWNIDGEADGYMPKVVGAFLMPAVLAIMFVLLILVPRIDPLRANIESFMPYYHGFILVMMAFLFFVHLQSMLWNLGFMVSFNLTMPVLLGGLFFYLGILLEKSKRNWFIGIRTPWTLSSDEVWDKTHKLGGNVFKAAAILMLAALVLPSYAFLIIILMIVCASLGTAVYSYFVYREIMKK